MCRPRLVKDRWPEAATRLGPVVFATEPPNSIAPPRAQNSGHVLHGACRRGQQDQRLPKMGQVPLSLYHS